jgi:tetraacyldisaccharide 4'-kinase
VRSALGVLALGYSAAARLRNLGYDRGWFPTHRAAVPVISVGNLTAGGTGKTPMVEWITRWFRQRELRVALLSRGYGRSTGLNDEGLVLDENLPDVPHLQDPDRVAISRIAVAELEAQLLILDDGFQHRRLARDLDIVLLDALEPFGGGRLLPRGLLREPVSSLRRAGVVVLSKADLIPPSERASIRAAVERAAGPLPWVESKHAPLDLRDAEGNSFPLAEIKEKAVAAFCGIGNPEGFRRTLEPRCGRVLDLRTFPDHHPYTGGDVSDLATWAVELGADLILTTQKDFVKLRTSTLGRVPLRALRIGLEVMDGAPALEHALAALLPSGED